MFPWCTRPARALEPDEHDADCDHRVPYAKVRAQLLLQRRPALPAASPGQDPRRLVLHRPGTRDLCVDQPARVPVPARPPRHPRREPRPAPPPAGPLHPTPGRLTPPPRTPPDHHRRGRTPVRTRTGPSSTGPPGVLARSDGLIESRQVPVGGRVARTCDFTSLGRLGRRGVTQRPPTGRARPHRPAFGRRGPRGHVIGRRARPWRRVGGRGPQRSLPGLDRLDRPRSATSGPQRSGQWSTDATGVDGLDRWMVARSDDLTGLDRPDQRTVTRTSGLTGFPQVRPAADQGRAGRPLLNLFPRGVGEYCYAWRDRKR